MTRHRTRAVPLALVAAVCLVVGCSSPPSNTPAAPPRPTLEAVLEASLKDFRADTGVFVKHLTTGEQAGVRGDKAFNSYSVIKLAIMVRAYQLAEAGQLNLDERVRIRREDLLDGSGMLFMFDPGLQVTIRDLVTQMIITSDNTATDLLLARVGGVDAVNRWLAEAGFTKTRMVQSVSDFFGQILAAADPAYANTPPHEITAWMLQSVLVNPELDESFKAAADRLRAAVPPGKALLGLDARRSNDPAYWLGSMTPAETGRFLEALYSGRLAGPVSTRQMRLMLDWQREGTLRLPHYINYFGSNAQVSHKTGDGPPGIANDVGWIDTPGGVIVIAFFSANNTAPYPEHEDRIGRLAKAVVDHFATTSTKESPPQ